MRCRIRNWPTCCKPWLGQGAERLAIPVPAVIAVRLTDAAADLEPLSRRLADAAPGTLVEDHGVWIRRLTVLARSLQACAGLALLLVAGVAAAVIAVATRAGLSTRREAIEIVHGLGATDRYIAGRFAARATLLAAVGAAGGAVAALPVLLTLAQMAAPFAGETGATAAIRCADALARLAGAALAGACRACRSAPRRSVSPPRMAPCGDGCGGCHDAARRLASRRCWRWSAWLAAVVLGRRLHLVRASPRAGRSNRRRRTPTASLP